MTSGSVRSDVTGEAVEILLGILDGAREGFTDAEVPLGVDYVGKTAPGRYATADAVADEAAALALEGLPLDFTTRNLRAVARAGPRRPRRGLPPGRDGGVDRGPRRGRRHGGARPRRAGSVGR